MTFLEHIITPSSRRGKKPPESTASSLAVSFVGSGRNIPICLVAVGLHGNLKVHHIQIFGGSVMQKIQASKISSTNFEEWDKSRPISFLASPQEHRRGVSAWVQVNGGKNCWRYCAIDGMIHTTIWRLNFTFPEERFAAMLPYSCVLTQSNPCRPSRCVRRSQFQQRWFFHSHSKLQWAVFGLFPWKSPVG